MAFPGCFQSTDGWRIQLPAGEPDEGQLLRVVSIDVASKLILTEYYTPTTPDLTPYVQGTTGTTANKLVTATGTNKTVQVTPVQADSSGNVTGVAALTASGIFGAADVGFSEFNSTTLQLVDRSSTLRDILLRNVFANSDLWAGANSSAGQHLIGSHGNTGLVSTNDTANLSLKLAGTNVLTANALAASLSLGSTNYVHVPNLQADGAGVFTGDLTTSGNHKLPNGQVALVLNQLAGTGGANAGSWLHAANIQAENGNILIGSDVWLTRSTTKTATIDDGSGGAVNLIVKGTVGTTGSRLSTVYAVAMNASGLITGTAGLTISGGHVTTTGGYSVLSSGSLEAAAAAGIGFQNRSYLYSPADGSLTFRNYNNNADSDIAAKNGVFSGYAKPASKTIASLGSASAAGSGAMYVLSDSGKVGWLVRSNGTIWEYVHDNSAV